MVLKWSRWELRVLITSSPTIAQLWSHTLIRTLLHRQTRVYSPGIPMLVTSVSVGRSGDRGASGLSSAADPARCLAIAIAL